MSVALLICGPPCSGKTTLARAMQARFGGTALDWDELYVEMTGGEMHGPRGPASFAVEEEFRRQAAAVRRPAFIIRSAPEKRKRAMYRRMFTAYPCVVVLPLATNLERLASSDRTDEHKRFQSMTIRQWHAAFEPSAKDVRVNGTTEQMVAVLSPLMRES